MEEQELKTIKETIEKFLQKMTVDVLTVELNSSLVNNKECVNVDIHIKEPQVLIGQSGQTLFELGRLLRIILNKKLQKDFYVDLDINDYKKQKLLYLKKMAADLAREVVVTQKEKILPPMPSYERRIIHSELAGRQDIITQSHGEGVDRSVIISPK